MDRRFSRLEGSSHSPNEKRSFALLRMINE
jgi:hypothetical protein